MATQQAATDEPRVPLSRDRVLRAAIGLADEAGIESLSMRKLGAGARRRGDVAVQPRRQQGRHPERHRRHRRERDRAAATRSRLEGGPPDDGASRPTTSSSDIPWAAEPHVVGERSPARAMALHERDPRMPSGGRLLGRDDRSRLSRPGEPHRGVHAVGGAAGGRRGRASRPCRRPSSGSFPPRTSRTSSSTSISTSRSASRTTRARSRSGST